MNLTEEQKAKILATLAIDREDYETVVEMVFSWYTRATRDEVIDAIEDVVISFDQEDSP